MGTVTVYNYKIWHGGEYVIARRKATRSFIEGLRNAILLENTAEDLDAAQIDDNGQTDFDFGLFSKWGSL